MKHPLGGSDRRIDVALLIDLVATVAVVALSAIDRVVVLLAGIARESSRHGPTALLCQTLSGYPPPTSLPSDEWYDLLALFEERIDSTTGDEQHAAAQRFLAASGAFFLSHRARLAWKLFTPCTDTDDPLVAAAQRKEMAGALDEAVEKADDAATVLLSGSRAADPVDSLRAAVLGSSEPSEHQVDDRRKEVEHTERSAPDKVRMWLSYRAEDRWRYPNSGRLPARDWSSLRIRFSYNNAEDQEPLFEIAQRHLAETRSQLADTLGFLTDHTLPRGSLWSHHRLSGVRALDLVFMVDLGDPVVVEHKRTAPTTRRWEPPRVWEVAQLAAVTPVHAVWCGSDAGSAGSMTAALVSQRSVMPDWQVSPASALPRGLTGGVVLGTSSSTPALDTVSDALLNLADEMRRQGRLHASLACYSSARWKFHAVRDHLGERNALLRKAEALRLLGRDDEATRSAEEADKITENGADGENPLLQVP